MFCWNFFPQDINVLTCNFKKNWFIYCYLIFRLVCVGYCSILSLLIAFWRIYIDVKDSSLSVCGWVNVSLSETLEQRCILWQWCSMAGYSLPHQYSIIHQEFKWTLDYWLQVKNKTSAATSRYTFPVLESVYPYKGYSVHIIVVQGIEMFCALMQVSINFLIPSHINASLLCNGCNSIFKFAELDTHYKIRVDKSSLYQNWMQHQLRKWNIVIQNNLHQWRSMLNLLFHFSATVQLG